MAIAGTATLHSKPTIKIEPTATPGVHEVVQIEPFIRAFREQGEPPILNSHDMRPVSNLVDRFLFFWCGRVVASLDSDGFDNRGFLAHVAGVRARPRHDVGAA
ncbi:MAG: hypothetical protein OXL68_07750 [Paracoccaceae bacterium]|nr:hypothetical protein [Paracoccaceae bacterium]